MESTEEIVQYLRDALAHLYDPAYHPPEGLWTLTGCEPLAGVESLQKRLISAIEGLRPAPSVPQAARVRRIYDLLNDRHVRQLTQEETAARLGITPRHLRREQQEAIEVLAQRLCDESAGWSTSHGVDVAEKGPQVSQPGFPDPGATEWRSQVQAELASLQESAVGAVADVEETVRGAVALQSRLVSRRGIDLEIERLEPDLSAAIHPSALRQVLIAAISKLSERMSSGRIALAARREGKSVGLEVVASPVSAEQSLDGGLVEEILAAQRGSISTRHEGDVLSLHIVLPSVDKMTVLVVDDNMDLVHFYRRYTTGTRYQIVHTPRGRDVLEMIDDVAPAVIVLDVMLPDVDGWELLMHLYENPSTRSIPVVVCSVVREKELALSLGACLYLTKPVRRRQFIEALDQASSQIPT